MSINVGTKINFHFSLLVSLYEVVNGVFCFSMIECLSLPPDKFSLYVPSCHDYKALWGVEFLILENGFEQ